MREEEIGTYEMLWDCSACGTPKLLGIQHRHCPGCGSPQDPTARYYPSEEDKIAIQDHVYQGADRVCPGCSTPNASAAQFCTGCGAPLEGDAKEAVGRGEQQAGMADAFAGESVKDAKADARARRDAMAASALGKGHAKVGSPGMSRGLKIGLIVGGIVLVLAIVIIVLFVWKKEAMVELEGHRWTRTVEIQTFKDVRDSAWCDQMPRKARSVTKKKEKRSTKKIKDGETCTKKRKDNRDGTFKEVKECKPKFREEPVYDQKCYFQVEKWTTERTEKAEGQSRDPAPEWPTFALTREGSCKGCQREGSRNETYTLMFVDKKEGETYECPVERSVWDSSEVGSKWKAEVGMVSSSPDCDSFQPVP